MKKKQAHIDFGTCMADTLRLYKDIVARNDPSSNDPSKPWEVYAFEAHPLIQPYVEKFVDYLEGRGPKPPLTTPPCGSTICLSHYADKYGCGKRNASAMRACMFEVFKEPLRQIAPNPKLNNSQLIQKRLATAASPAKADRFVFVPSAASDFDGLLDIGSVASQNLMVMGGVAASKAAGHKVYEGKVQSVNAAAWMLKYFVPEDYVVVKMDIEGAEFGILRELLKKSPCLIDVLALECHSNAGNCKDLDRTIRSHSCIKVLYEGRDYNGWDHHSTPDKYYPIDPRS